MTMGCPQSKTKNKNISEEEKGAGPDINRKNGIRPVTEATEIPKKTTGEQTNAGRADPATGITPVFDAETESKENKDNKEKESNNTESKPAPTSGLVTDETTQNGCASVYQADEDDNVAEYDRIREKDKTEGETVDVDDINIAQGVTEIELRGQTIGVDVDDAKTGESKKSGSNMVPFENGVETSDVIAVEGGYMEHKYSLKNHPNVRYQNKDNVEYGLPKDVPKPAPPKTKKSEIIQPTTFSVADKIVDETPDAAYQTVPKLSSYLSGQVKKSEVKEDVQDPGEGKNIPSPKPSKTQKKNLVKDIARFKSIDENAKNTPESVRLSVQKLADHLCKNALNDLEKVRAFYYWICHNIRYMYDADSVSERLRYDAVSTLRQGKGSYVNLMAALCNEAKIPVVTIPGCSKGLRHQPDKVFTVAEQNHSWNAVYINDEWRFIDCTWGSGYLAQDGKFHSQFDEFWFLTDPAIFIYDHFPVHPNWQLLETPIDIDEFNHRPSLTEKSRELGLRLVSHREPIVYFDNEVTITFGTDTIPLSNITADLRDLRTEDLKEANKYRCIQRQNGKEFSVRVVPPGPGEYMLTIFGKSKDYLHAKFRKLVEYTLRCESVYEEPVMFPDHYKAWGPEPNYSELGFVDSIQELSVLNCKSNEHVITLEQTKNVAVTVEFRSVKHLETELNEYTLITATEKSKSIHLRFPSEGYYKLDIYAEGKLEKYEFTAAMLIYCSANEKPSLFPKYNAESVAKFKCRLIEPLIRELPANTDVMFQIESRDLKKVMLGIPVETATGQGMKNYGELKKDEKLFSATLKTPGKGESLYLAGCSSAPKIFWSRMYEFVTV